MGQPLRVQSSGASWDVQSSHLACMRPRVPSPAPHTHKTCWPVSAHIRTLSSCCKLLLCRRGQQGRATQLAQSQPRTLGRPEAACLLPYSLAEGTCLRQRLSRTTSQQNGTLGYTDTPGFSPVHCHSNTGSSPPGALMLLPEGDGAVTSLPTSYHNNLVRQQPGLCVCAPV